METAVPINIEGYVNNAYATLKESVNKEEKSSIQKVTLLIKAMEIVEDFTELTGLEKKEVVLKTVEKVIRDVLDDKENESQEDLELIINFVIMASKGLLHINIKDVHSCWSKMFDCKKKKVE